METMTPYRHVRLRPGMYGLHGNYFKRIFKQSILDLLHEYSFTVLKISTVPERNEIIFEASERRTFHAAQNYWSFILIAGISSSAKFCAEFKDGSFRRTIIKEAVPCEGSFGIYRPSGCVEEAAGFYPNTDLERLELRFILPKEFPIDENYARSRVHDYSRIFPHAAIIYNGYEYQCGKAGNKITSLLRAGHPSFGSKRKIYEFHSGDGDLSWEVSFTFDDVEKKTISFINGIETTRGGTHVDCVTKAIVQAFRKTQRFSNCYLRNLSLAVSIHLPPEKECFFDSCRFAPDLRLASAHPEFQEISRELQKQIERYFSISRRERSEFGEK